MTEILILSSILAIVAVLLSLAVAGVAVFIAWKANGRADEVLDGVAYLIAHIVKLEKRLEQSKVEVSAVVEDKPDSIKEAEKKAEEAAERFYIGLANMLSYDGKPPAKDGAE